MTTAVGGVAFDAVAFTPGEQARIMARPEPERAIARTGAWVRKEAVLKRAGVGLTVPPAEFDVAASGDVLTEIDVGERLPMRAGYGGTGSASPSSTRRRGWQDRAARLLNSQASNRSSSGRPATDAARARKSAVSTEPCRCSLVHRRSRPKKAFVSEVSRSACKRESAAFVDAVVEHPIRAGIREHEILGQHRQPEVVTGGQPFDRRRPGRLRPQPLGVTGEALVQPDVAPGRSR